ncbi:PREDICTED: E3 ubiquitin-protein ligase sina isoform X2 [Dinoponera quadriceps]|uniref:E3 ubiquitin-protein ligase sina isoform X2 n=1 Tax=Dinoponera quadriceps TaxID=609295 RepID=A0A6P3XXH8_DINQU|nr:PREDICTED: E3 ubiquitin-protein ligase sina isoform X2 [Dinoponera quadriceps]
MRIVEVVDVTYRERYKFEVFILNKCMKFALSCTSRLILKTQAWCDALEELLQCPVCLETTPTGTKHQCVNGHHICVACKEQVHSCPLCKSQFINTRNLAVEHITAKLEEIKLSLLHPYHALNRKRLKGKVCVATQTEGTCIPSTSYVSVSCQTETNENPAKENLPQHEPQHEQKQQLIILSPKVGKGQYPCRIGSCAVELPHGRMIGHLRYYHKNSFYEFSTKCYYIFKQNWNLEYTSEDYDYAFFIKGMGLFFLHLAVDHKGGLIGAVQMVNSNEAARQFVYALKVGGGPQGVRYSAEVKSCRKETLAEDYLYVRDGSMRRITYNNAFRCELTINRKNERRPNTVQENPSLNDVNNVRRVFDETNVVH